MKQIFMIFLLSHLSLLLAAQSNIRKVNLMGKVIDSREQPVAFANVILLDVDSTFLTGNITGEDGMFRFAFSGEAAMLKISYIGYLDKIIPLESGRIDMGKITMEEETQILGEVVVKGDLPITQLKGDALVTNVQNSVLAKIGSAKDVLAKIPGILKKEDAFEVFGKGTPLIYINGRQVRNQAELEQLNSDEIKNVEVITNPGARYDATVKAVIRIQTVKRQGDGFGFDVRSSYYQSQNTDWVEQLNFNYRHRNLDLFGSVDYTHNESLAHTRIEQENDVDNLWVQKNWMKDVRITDDVDVVAGVNFRMDEHHSFGGRYNIIAHPKSCAETTIRSEVTKNGQFYDNWSSLGSVDDDYTPEHQVNVYYNGSIGDLSIDFNADYYKKKQNTMSTTIENSQEQEDRTIRSFNPVDNQLTAGKLIFSYPVFGGEVSGGSEYSYTSRKDDYLSASSVYVPTSYSRIKEKNISVFAEYNHNLAFGRFSVGLRYEHVAFDYYEDHQYQEEQSRRYDNLYPDFSFATQLGKVQMQWSYTAKTKRPSYRELSNNVFYINRFTLQEGNPSLYPSLTHDLTWAASWKFLQAIVSYQHKKDEVIPWGTPQTENREVTLIRPINFNKIPTLQAFVAASPVLGCWSPTLSIGVSKQWMEVESSDWIVSMNRPMLTGAFSNLLSLPYGFTVGVDVSYQGKGNFLNVYSNRKIWVWDVSVRKSFLKEALSVELRGTDLFYKQRNSNIVYFSRLKGFQGDRFDTRIFVLTLRYKFNSTPSKYKGTGAGETEKRRL